MRRVFIIVIFIQCLMTAYSQNKGFSRWSFTPEIGYNYLDGDINQPHLSLLPTSAREVTYGLNIEYALTPIWGVALDGYYFPLRAKCSSPVSMLINTNMYTSSLLTTINFTRLVFPNSRSKVYFLGSIGLGVAYYTYDLQYFNGSPIGAGDTYIDSKLDGKVRPVRLYVGNSLATYGIAVTCPITFALEYNISRPFAVGAKVHYRAFTKDNLEGATYLNFDGVTNDFVAAGTLYLRFKLNALRKDHLRNIKMEDYAPDKGVKLAQQLDDRLKKLEKKVDGIGAKVDSLVPRVARLEQLLSNDGPDSDGDGVPDVRDKDNTTKPNTPVDFWGKEIPLGMYNAGTGYVANGSGAGRKSLYVPDENPSLYFDFDQITLDDNALITISKVATQMRKDPTLFVEVRGYCDYSGNNPYNNLLSQRRSDRVKEELVKVWGIPADHIISNGKGKVIEPRVKYRPNRRCDFYFGRL